MHNCTGFGSGRQQDVKFTSLMTGLAIFCRADGEPKAKGTGYGVRIGVDRRVITP